MILTYADDVDTFQMEDMEQFILTEIVTAGVDELYQRKIWKWTMQVLKGDGKESGVKALDKFRDTNVMTFKDLMWVLNLI